MKVSIPKERIDQIVSKYGCTFDDAIKAYLEANSEATQTFDDTLENILRKKKPAPLVKAHTPAEIKEHLDKYVIGQDNYKKRLSVAAAYHFAVVKKLGVISPEEKAAVKRFRKKNTLIAGPTGSGKTYSAEVLSDLLDVPINIVDATDYTEVGYVGKNADDMIRELIDMAPGESKREKADFITRFGGLIFIDEMDKKAKDTGIIGHDISREGFQRAVLKLIERKFIPVDNPYSPASQIQEAIDLQHGTKQDKSKSMISTENILFILGGSFQRTTDDLESIVKKRIERGTGRVKEDGSITVTGFSTPEDDKTRKRAYKNYYHDAEAEDYIRFGLIPELVGRAPIRTYVNPLSKNDLIRIMTETEDSILNQYKFEFALFGIEIEFEPDAIEYVADQAENSKTGARALVSVWERILTDFQFALPGKNFRKLTISKELCERPTDLLLELMQKSPILDFVERFRTDTGILLIIEEECEKYIEDYAIERNIQVSEAVQKLLSGVRALNYMNIDGKYVVTIEMLRDEKYFDNLYVRWHEEQLTKASQV
ncbi:MAG: AAA family ATPase [Candidatus Riflebacteria bacterium]|nr:AAA family ATPase [Candidatus Riflebacteria bacterium]